MKTDQMYFNKMQAAIDALSLPQLQAALEECREHNLAISPDKRKTEPGPIASFTELACRLRWVVDSRSEGDLTPFIYTCALYRTQKLRGNEEACQTLDQIADWLIKIGATVFAEGARPIERAFDRRTGRTWYDYGRGKNVVEAIGQDLLPPSVQRYIVNLAPLSEIRRDVHQPAAAEHAPLPMYTAA